MKRYIFSFRFHLYLTNPRWRKEQRRLAIENAAALARIKAMKKRIADAPVELEPFVCVGRPYEQGSVAHPTERVKIPVGSYS